MMFSKSFGYALRGLLYIALVQDERRKVQVDEIAGKLGVPRHFMGKIMKRLVKEGLLLSVKGPYGGFSLSGVTLQTPLYRLIEITDGLSTFDNCVLRLRACSSANPCPLHFQMVAIKNSLQELLVGTMILDLLQHDKEKFIQSIATEEFGVVLENLVINNGK
jgi:Rrf2 family protein